MISSAPRPRSPPRASLHLQRQPVPLLPRPAGQPHVRPSAASFFPPSLRLPTPLRADSGSGPYPSQYMVGAKAQGGQVPHMFILTPGGIHPSTVKVVGRYVPGAVDDAASAKKQHRRSKRQQEAALRAHLKETMPGLFVPRRKPQVSWLDERSRGRVSSRPPAAQQARKKPRSLPPGSSPSRRREMGRQTPPLLTAAALMMMPPSTVPPRATAAPERPVEPQREAAEEPPDDPFLSLRFLSDAASWSPRHVAPLVTQDLASGSSLMTDSGPYEEESPSGPSERSRYVSAAVSCDPGPCSWASTYLHARPCEKSAEVYEPLGGRYDMC